MPSAMVPIYRPMTPADIDATGYIRKAALQGLAASQNQAWDWRPRRYGYWAHLLSTDPDGAWVAEIGGTVVGFAMGFVRGDTWFLAQLFVQPEVHAHGIGRELLRLSQEAGRSRGARVFSVVSSTSPVSQALYMRAGMFALGIGYNIAGPVDALVGLPPPDATRKLVVECHGWQDRIADLDTQLWGSPRREDHALYLAGAYGDEEDYAFALNHDGGLVGYGYTSDTGHIGPVGAYAAADQLSLLRVAGDWLADREIGEANAFVISHNATVLGTLLTAGWRIRNWTFFLSTAPFGSFERYVPGSGVLL